VSLIPIIQSTTSPRPRSYNIWIPKLPFTNSLPASFLNLPPELLQRILEFVLFNKPPYAPMHLHLLAPRHVCRDLRIHVESVMRKTLNASLCFLQAGQESEIRKWFKRGTDSSSAKFWNTVRFKLDAHCPLNLELWKYFFGALHNCRQARVEIQVPVDLVGRPNRIPGVTTTTVPRSQIREFSWISSTLGT